MMILAVRVLLGVTLVAALTAAGVAGLSYFRYDNWPAGVWWSALAVFGLLLTTILTIQHRILCTIIGDPVATRHRSPR